MTLLLTSKPDEMKIDRSDKMNYGMLKFVSRNFVDPGKIPVLVNEPEGESDGL